MSKRKIKKYYFFFFFLLVVSSSISASEYLLQRSERIDSNSDANQNLFSAIVLQDEEYHFRNCDFVIGRIYNVTHEDKYISFETINYRELHIHILNGKLVYLHPFHYRRGYSVFFHNFDRFIGILTPHFICGIIYAGYDVVE